MSMCKALQMEFWKCRRRMVGLVCLAFVAVQLLWVGRTLFDMTPEELSQGWMLIVYDLILIDAIMMPTTAAVLASRNCDLEHKGSTLKLLETLVPAGCSTPSSAGAPSTSPPPCLPEPQAFSCWAGCSASPSRCRGTSLACCFSLASLSR